MGGNGGHGNRGGYGSVSASGAYGYEGGYGSGLEGGNGMVGGYRSGSGSGANGIGGGYGSEGLKSKLGDSFRKCDPNNPSCPSDEVCGCRNPMRMMEWMCCKPNNPAFRH